jgi:hypothetical protein
MAKGEVPVAYIIALIIAIIIIAIVAYMFFTHTGIFEGSSIDAQCNAKRTQYCIEWHRVDPTFSGTGIEWSTFAPGCGAFDQSATICKGLLGIKKADGASCSSNYECASNDCSYNTATPPVKVCQ